MAPTTEVDLLGEAVDGTEREIFSEGVGDQPLADEAGDRSLEDIEGDLGTEDADDDGDEDADTLQADDRLEPEADRQQPQPRENGRFAARDQQQQPQRGQQAPQRVPVSELLDERRARQAAETTLASERTAFTQRFTALEQRLDALMRPPQNPQQQQQPGGQQVPEVDIFSDPNKVLTDLRTSMSTEYDQKLTNARVEMSFALAHDSLGEKFETAYKELTTLDHRDPVARSTVQRIMAAPNPAKALMTWHGNQSIAKEVNGDPAAYRQRVRDEILKDPAVRQQIIDDLRAEANGGQRPANNGQGARHVVRAPANNGAQRRSIPSLNTDAAGGSAQVADPELYDSSDRSTFDFVWRQ